MARLPRPEGDVVRRRRSIVFRKPSGSRPEDVEPKPRAAEPRDGGARRAHGALQIAGDVAATGGARANRGSGGGGGGAGAISHAPAGRPQASHPRAKRRRSTERTPRRRRRRPARGSRGRGGRTRVRVRRLGDARATRGRALVTADDAFAVAVPVARAPSSRFATRRFDSTRRFASRLLVHARRVRPRAAQRRGGGGGELPRARRRDLRRRRRERRRELSGARRRPAGSSRRTRSARSRRRRRARDRPRREGPPARRRLRAGAGPPLSRLPRRMTGALACWSRTRRCSSLPGRTRRARRRRRWRGRRRDLRGRSIRAGRRRIPTGGSVSEGIIGRFSSESILCGKTSERPISETLT